jgi:hypothetical protein
MQQIKRKMLGWEENDREIGELNFMLCSSLNNLLQSFKL